MKKSIGHTCLFSAILVVPLIGFALWRLNREIPRQEAQFLVARARAEVAAGRFAIAETTLRQAVSFDPRSVDALRALGALELRRNHLEEAVRWLKQAEQVEPGSYETIYNLGLAYRGLGDQAEAARYRDEAAGIRKTLPPKPGGMGAMPAEMK